MRADFETVWRNLIGRPQGPDNEPAPITWLRSYSNYLTPQLGIMSADTWAIMSVYVNLVLNWLVVLPVVCAVILLLKILVLVLIGFARLHDPAWAGNPSADRSRLRLARCWRRCGS